MGILEALSKLFGKKTHENGLDNSQMKPENKMNENFHTNGKDEQSPDIPKEVFISDETPNSSNGLERIYAFLQARYEERGYKDALKTPDTKVRDENIRQLKEELKLLIDQAKIYYNDLLSETDTEIEIQTRAGFLDLVRRLEGHRQQIEHRLKKVEEIEQGIDTENSPFQNVKRNYEIGFSVGITDLVTNNLLNKKIE